MDLSYYSENYFIQLDEAGLTHTYCDVLRCLANSRISTTCVGGMWNTGAGPYEEWAEEWLHDGEV